MLLFALVLAGCQKDSDIKDPPSDTGPATTDSPADTYEPGDTQDSAPPEDTGWDERYDTLMAALQSDLDSNIAAAVQVAVMENGQVSFAYTLGSRHPDREEDLSNDTLFQIGSDTKKHTAVALLQKVQDGLVSLDDNLDTTLPDLEFALDETWDDQILVQHLLTHQGAFYDWIPWDQSDSDSLLQSYTYGYFANNLWLMNPPGVFWNYSNPNFVLAGLITEENDTRAWPDIMVEDVYQPLGMDRSYLRKSEVEADGDYAIGYGVDMYGNYGTVELDDVPDPGWGRPAGLTWSTATQQLYFADFLINGDEAVLSDELTASIHDEHVNTLYYDDEMHYGYGLMVNRGFQVGQDYYQVPYWKHGGNTLSYSSEFHVLPEHGFAISILSSGYGSDFSSSVAAALGSLVEGLPEPVDPPAYVIDTDRFALHEGAYYDQYNVGEVNIWQEGDELHISMPLLDKYGYSVTEALYALTSDIHYVQLNGNWYDLTFIAEDKGEPSQYIRNRIFVSTRADEQKALGERRVPSTQDVARWMQAARVNLPIVRLPEPALH